MQKFMPRVETLRRIEGWYEYQPDTFTWRLYRASGTKLAFRKWLIREYPNKNESWRKFEIETAKPVTFKVTCKYNDILRCSQMFKRNYFTSCLRPNGAYGDTPPIYCADVPQIGMLYVPDAAGHVRSRVFLYSEHPGEITPLRFYGSDNLRGCIDVVAKQHNLVICQLPGTWAIPGIYVDITPSYWM